MLNKSIDRIEAEKDMRTLNIAICSQSNDGFKTLVDRLQKQLGEIATYEKSKVNYSGAPFEMTITKEQMLKEAVYDRESLLALKGINKVR